MKYIYISLRIILGLLFIFSGYVKAVDPWGTAIKFNEYFEAMGLDFFKSLSFILSNMLSIIELLVGYLLVFNVKMKWTSRTAFLLMLLFTPLTLWLALTGKVTDCGCFGDAIKMTDWQTFYKNIVLISISTFILIFAKKYPSKINTQKQRLLFILIALFSIGIVYFSYQHLPLIDFRPFKIGSDIKKGSEIPEDAEHSIYETTLIYEKDGVQKKFNEDNYPWQDTTWHFVNTEQKLIKKGYTPPIQDFFIETLSGDNITETILSEESCLLIISYKVEQVNFVKKYQTTYLKDVVKEAKTQQVPVYLLTASNTEQVENISSYLPPNINYCFADEKMLKTMIRANPGVLLLNKGIIAEKWNVSDLPKTISFLREKITAAPEKIKQNAYNNQIYFSLLLLIILAVINCVIIIIKKNELPNKIK